MMIKCGITEQMDISVFMYTKSMILARTLSLLSIRFLMVAKRVLLMYSVLWGKANKHKNTIEL